MALREEYYPLISEKQEYDFYIANYANTPLERITDIVSYSWNSSNSAEEVLQITISLRNNVMPDWIRNYTPDSLAEGDESGIDYGLLRTVNVTRINSAWAPKIFMYVLPDIDETLQRNLDSFYYLEFNGRLDADSTTIDFKANTLTMTFVNSIKFSKEKSLTKAIDVEEESNDVEEVESDIQLAYVADGATVETVLADTLNLADQIGVHSGMEPRINGTMESQSISKEYPRWTKLGEIWDGITELNDGPIIWQEYVYAWEDDAIEGDDRQRIQGYLNAGTYRPINPTRDVVGCSEFFMFDHDGNFCNAESISVDWLESYGRIYVQGKTSDGDAVTITRGMGSITHGINPIFSMTQEFGNIGISNFADSLLSEVSVKNLDMWEGSPLRQRQRRRVKIVNPKPGFGTPVYKGYKQNNDDDLTAHGFEVGSLVRVISKPPGWDSNYNTGFHIGDIRAKTFRVDNVKITGDANGYDTEITLVEPTGWPGEQFVDYDGEGFES